ncbi:MAG: DUF1735 domain-containing protein [Bacteroidales bacterium]|nr:DUF1735 domain-containing protein [Bacteroidales bacterium]
MKKILSLFMIPVMGLLALSCEKPGQEGGGNTGAAVLGVSVTDLPQVVEVPQNQSQSFEILVVANPGPSEAIQVTLGTDESLVAKYNAANGTAYEMLPSAAFELPSSALMVMKYNKTSVPGTLKLIGAGCEQGKTYVLPVVVSSVKGNAAYEAPEDRVAYVVFKMLAAQMAGSGTQADPYLVTNTEEFNKIGNILKSGETVYVKLAADIDYNGAAWTQADATGAPVYLDGDNHVVKNVNALSGLFLNLEGTVKNITFDGVKVEAGAAIAGILADAAGSSESAVTISNVKLTNATMNNVGQAGGLIGKLTNSTVDNVEVNCTVTGTSRVAGVVGHAVSSTITNTTVAGTVTGTDYYLGGLVGLMYDCTVKNCSAAVNVTCESLANAYARIGGLVGEIFKGGLIEKCHATGTIIGKGYFGGGLVGVIDTVEDVDGVSTVGTVTIKQSYATGSVSLIRDGNAKDAGAGGLVGCLEKGKAVITDCYATGAIEADRYSAGFFGDLYASTEVTITNGFTNADLTKLGPDANGNHSDGVAIGSLRADDVKISIKGFVAWSDNPNKKFIYQDKVPVTGNYHGTEGTISAQAKALGWDESIWDLSADIPKLK